MSNVTKFVLIWLAVATVIGGFCCFVAFAADAFLWTVLAIIVVGIVTNIAVMIYDNATGRREK